eukprot:scaffold35898_cov110-Skeletonema_marinoi.AAC.1
MTLVSENAVLTDPVDALMFIVVAGAVVIGTLQTSLQIGRKRNIVQGDPSVEFIEHNMSAWP